MSIYSPAKAAFCTPALPPISSRRVYQHKLGLIPGFTQRYGVNRLVYFESTSHIRSAIERERQVKSWRREKKLRLIESMNAGWLDLSADWFRETDDQGPSLRSG